MYRGNCKQLGKYRIDRRTETHNHLLHDKNEKKEDNNQENKNESGSTKNDERNGAVTADGIDHNEHCNTSMKFETVLVMALRTVKLKNENKELVVNALLDASTTSYIIYDVAAELELQGPLKTVSIRAMNGNVNTYQTMPVACELLSCHETLKHYILAYTTNKITGNMRPIEWRVNANK